jgi:hypothetical protein
VPGVGTMSFSSSLGEWLLGGRCRPGPFWPTPEALEALAGDLGGLAPDPLWPVLEGRAESSLPLLKEGIHHILSLSQITSRLSHLPLWQQTKALHAKHSKMPKEIRLVVTESLRTKLKSCSLTH